MIGNLDKSVYFTFCGLDSYDDLKVIVNQITRPIVPSMTEHSQDIPGMYGNLFQGMSYGAKTINIDCTILAESEEEAAAIKHDLADVLIHPGVDGLPMVFSDEAEYTYYGHVSAVTEPNRWLQNKSFFTFSITFTCSDPYSYGETRQNIQVTTNPQKLIPNGTAEIYPIFTCVPKKSVTKIAVTDSDGNYAYVGDNLDPDTKMTLTNLEPRIINDPCTDLSTWSIVTNPSFIIENGVVSGKMKASDTSILVADTTVKVDDKDKVIADFGPSSPGNWHGPCVQKYLSKSISDYRIRVRMTNNQYYSRAKGKCELYLLNETGTRVGRISLKDNGNSKEVTVLVEIGTDSKNHDIYFGEGKVKKKKDTAVKLKTSTGTKKVKVAGKTKTEQIWKTINTVENDSTSAYTNFYGYIELQKIGNKYKVEIMPFDDKSNPIQSKSLVIKWTDTKNEYVSKLAGVAFYTAKYDSAEDLANPRVYYRNNVMRLNDLKIYEILGGGNGTLSTPTEIADAGDEVKINCEDHNAYRNGVLMNGLYAGSNFPKMKGSIAETYAFEPPLEEADWYITYRPTRR